jgi:hypothetical protein
MGQKALGNAKIDTEKTRKRPQDDYELKLRRGTTQVQNSKFFSLPLSKLQLIRLSGGFLGFGNSPVKALVAPVKPCVPFIGRGRERYLPKRLTPACASFAVLIFNEWQWRSAAVSVG